jgi:heat-inducible transcriptional repressor
MLDTRKQAILDEVVNLYIERAEPVGSKLLSEHSAMSVSTATIRHELNELEKEGYLTQPHTSSGRIPTDKGYRFHVDRLADTGHGLTLTQQRVLQSQLFQAGHTIQGVLDQISDILHSLIDYTTIVLTPTIYQETLKVAHLLLVDLDKVLVVLLNSAGVNSEFLLSISHRIDQEDLNKISRLLTEKLSGQAIKSITPDMLTELAQELPQVSSILDTLGVAIQQLSSHQKEKRNIMTKGVGNLLKLPEFQNIELTQKVLTTLEETKVLSAVLSEYCSQPNCQVFIGHEHNVEGLQDCSLVVAQCAVGQDQTGIIGVIGPKRMNYATVLPMVTQITTMINQYTNGGGER